MCYRTASAGEGYTRGSAVPIFPSPTAKLAVKIGKRMLRDNVSAQGKMNTLNTDMVMRARMQYHNTPITDVGRSPSRQ